MPDQQDVVQLIMDDHREVERLFGALRAQRADRPLLLPQLTSLLEELAWLDPDSAECDTKLAELTEAVSHHVEEEESKVLPGLKERLTPKKAGRRDTGVGGGPRTS